MNPIKILSIIVTVFVMLPKAEAASFDCAKASTLVENVICSDAEISALDDSLAASYRQAMVQAGDDADKLKKTQLNWLKKRNACKDKTCVNNMYLERIAELETLSSPLPKRVGDCIDAHIISKTTRFEGAVAGETGGEIIVEFDKELGLYLQGVDGLTESDNLDRYMYATSEFQEGDKVKLCLQALPTECPPGDNRGKVYSVFNYKNRKSFVGVDSWHLCGGA